MFQLFGFRQWWQAGFGSFWRRKVFAERFHGTRMQANSEGSIHARFQEQADALDQKQKEFREIRRLAQKMIAVFD